jgi:hypothetical protein
MSNGSWEAYVPWIFVALGCVVAFGVGYINQRAGGGIGFWYLLGTALLSIVVGLPLTFASSYANSYCIKKLHMCQDWGDGNMAFWFQSLFAIPLFWAIMLIVAAIPRDKE